MRSTAVIAMMLVVFCGCDGRRSAPRRSTAPAGNVVFRDAAGDAVATAQLELPEVLPAGDGTFKGDWKLLSSGPAFPSGSTRSGRYEGSVHGGQISINLNPGVADSNVVLGGSAGTEPITGTWHHATFAGPKEMGTFTLTRRPGRSR